MARGCPAESPLLRNTAGIRYQLHAALRNGFPYGTGQVNHMIT